MKNEKKTTWVFLYIKYSKFWSVLLEHFVECKPLISEQCLQPWILLKLFMSILVFFRQAYFLTIWNGHAMEVNFEKIDLTVGGNLSSWAVYFFPSLTYSLSYTPLCVKIEIFVQSTSHFWLNLFLEILSKIRIMVVTLKKKKNVCF